jgi:hypothetical protein
MKTQRGALLNTKTSVFNLTETQPEIRVFFKKPNPNLTRNFKTQTQPKPEFENLTQPKKTGFILGCFSKKNF